VPPEASHFASGLSLVAVLILALLHIVAARVHGMSETRPRWLSGASGISVAYVFVQLMPDLAEGQELWLQARPEPIFQWLGRQIYLMALVGLVLALGMERLTASRKHRDRARFRMHAASFAVYNLLIGGLALRLGGVIPVVLAVLAFGAHLLVHDHHLQREFGAAYQRVGRWLFAGSLLSGWLLETLFDVPVVIVSALLGLVAGGIILNVIKEELPEQGEGAFGVFVAGTTVYSSLLLALAYIQHPS
jgi:hypothetical protein